MYVGVCMRGYVKRIFQFGATGITRAIDGVY